jgi:hypothetical protein
MNEKRIVYLDTAAQQKPSKKLFLLIWLLPVLYLIHDTEEILTIQSFIQHHSDTIPFSISTLQFTIAFILLWIVATIGCYQAARNRSFLGMQPIPFFSFLVPGILLANGVGHLLQAMYFHSYVPGLFTAILVIFPYSIYTLKYFLDRRLLTLKKFIRFFLLGFVLQGPFAFLALFLSNLFVK